MPKTGHTVQSETKTLYFYLKFLGIINMAMLRRKSSDNLLDTADDLVDRLDNLADILAEIEDTYQSVGSFFIF